MTKRIETISTPELSKDEIIRGAFHPGYYVENWMVIKKINKVELAKRLEMSEDYVEDLINGRVDLSAIMAFKLAKATETSPDMWLELRSRYMRKMAEVDATYKAEMDEADFEV